MPLDPRTLRIGVGDDKYATIVHPIKQDRFALHALGCPPPSIRGIRRSRLRCTVRM